jgi:AcrR family transcriptional regulator
MPKIIENLDQRLMEEARRQIKESGYSAMTIRSVAAACGVGVGTVYNYYPSKEALVATFILEDWNACYSDITARAESARGREPVLWAIYENLQRFITEHAAVFQDESAAASFTGSFSQYHGLLRSQLAAPVRRFCRDDFTAEFIAEAMLTWIVAGKNFDEMSKVLQRIF